MIEAPACVPEAEAIGLIGVGLVGSGLAALLLERGYRVVGCDIDPERATKLAEMGGIAVASPAAVVAAGCDRVVLSLMTTASACQVIEGTDGLLSVARPPGYIIDSTTGDPDETVALAARLADRGVVYVDATISGSSEQIRARAGTFMVGGDADAFAHHRDLFDCFSDRVYHLGPAGSGSRCKLASNLILGLNRLALAEGLVFAEGLGLDLDVFLTVLKNSPAYSAAVDAKGQRMLDGAFAPASRISQHAKDVELILSYADRAGQILPLSAVHGELLAGAVAAGDGALDNGAIIRQVRRLCGQQQNLNADSAE